MCPDYIRIEWKTLLLRVNWHILLHEFQLSATAKDVEEEEEMEEMEVEEKVEVECLVYCWISTTVWPVGNNIRSLWWY